jgi:hypothetical protein
VCFIQVEQTLKLGDFLGHTANAIRWQVSIALLVQVLLRYAPHISQWGRSFTQLSAVTRAAIWERLDLIALLRSCGGADVEVVTQGQVFGLAPGSIVKPIVELCRGSSHAAV